MSFNNTRTTRQSGVAGRAVPPTQVTYHPRPQAQQQFQQQGQAPQFQQQAQVQQPPVQQQQQQQPLPQQQQQQQQQQQAPSQMYKMQQQSPVQAKVEPKTPMKTPQQTPSTTPLPIPQPSQAVEGTTEVVEGVSRPWKKHKNLGFKVNKVQKRRRQNARFRKLLIPKNAMMVLNELQPGVVFDSDENTNAFNQLTYTVRVEIDGTTYTGEGPSKAAAKANAAELAVKGLILSKIAESNVKKEPTDSGSVTDLTDDPMDADVADDSSDKGSQNGRRVIPEDEVPWGSLASFALFKLFADWKSQGNSIPPMVSAAAKPPTKAGVKAAQPPKPTMPENPEQLHPVTLIGRLHPGTLFSELSREGNPPNMTFTMAITINGQQYTGTAKSKKEAKKQCAISALKALSVPYDTSA